MAETGRPAYTDDTYQLWLKELEPFLTRGKSLYKAMQLAGLISKQTTIYEKYRLKDWFSQKVDEYGHEFGEIINDTMYDLVVDIAKKVKAKQNLTAEEVKIITFNAERHRSAQKYFVNRHETAVVKPIEEVIQALEEETIDDVAAQIKGEEIKHIDATATAQVEMVAPNPPVQDQGQAGADSPVQPQPDAAQA